MKCSGISDGCTCLFLVVKNPSASAKGLRDPDSIPGSGRVPGGGHGNPLQYSCLDNPMDRGAWQAMSIESQRVRHDWSELAWHGTAQAFVQFNSVTQSCPTLRLHGLQHARLPCPSPSPRVCSNSCLLSRWCHPTISSSVIPFSSCPQSFPASGCFLRSQYFSSGGQSIGTSA